MLKAFQQATDLTVESESEELAELEEQGYDDDFDTRGESSIMA